MHKYCWCGASGGTFTDKQVPPDRVKGQEDGMLCSNVQRENGPFQRLTSGHFRDFKPRIEGEYGFISDAAPL